MENTPAPSEPAAPRVSSSRAEAQADFATALRDGERHLAAADPVMAGLIRRFGPCGLDPAWDRSPYEALVRAVMYQQLHLRAAARILERFMALFPGGGFPTPDQILGADETTLRSAGLSRNKALAVQDIAAKARDGTVPDRAEAEGLNDAELIRRITAVRGVGVWTVQMMLIGTLGRLDVMPSADFGLRSGFRLAYGTEDLPLPREVEARTESWRPFRSVGSWYLFRTADAGKTEAPPSG